MMNDVEINSMRAWVLAARPKTLTGAGVPIMIGCSLAYGVNRFQLIPAVVCFLFAFIMQIDANFINDYYDFKKGIDRDDRLGPERACAQGWISLQAMWKGIVVVSVTACLVGSFVLFYAGWELIPIGLVCILFAFLYTGGPYPLAYHGWGDVLVILFFGFIPVGGTFYVMVHDWTWDVTVASTACGLAVNTLLMVNNYRDREQDKKSGKKTVVVRWGEKAGRQLYLLLGIAATELCLLFVFSGHLGAAVLPQFYLPIHFLTWEEMVRIREGKVLNIILGKTSRNILLFGLLLSLGLIL